MTSAILGYGRVDGNEYSGCDRNSTGYWNSTGNRTS
jgi:hypothetical protein